MANLSKVSDVTRKILEFSAIGIVAILLLVIIFKVGTFVKELIAPTPIPPPTVAFGKLSSVTFPQTTDMNTYSYSINTLSGALPNLPDRITVYKLQEPAPTLLGLDKAKDIAVAAKFLGDPVSLSDTSYQWSNSDPFPTTLTMDTQTLDFFLTGDYKDDATVTGAANMPDETTAQTISHQFFDTVMPLPDSIDPSKTKTTLLAINVKGLTPASSLSDAQIIRVDYFPKPIDTYPIYTSNPDMSLIYAYVASGDTDYPQIVEAQYYHKNVSTDKATYPIKSATTAYEDLKQGNGYIAANPTGATNITITDVSLGYYVDATPQQYLWPIIVFQGDKGFYAYVSAIPDEWVQK